MSIDWDAAPFPDLDTAQISAICRKHGLGAPPVGRMPSTGVVNSIYTLGAFVLRVPKNMPAALSDTYTESVACPVAFAHRVRTPRLVVWDEDTDIVDVAFTIHDLLHRDGHYAALIDWGDAAWRDASLEFASLSMVAVMGMLDGYRDVRPLEAVTTEARILWDKIVRCHNDLIRNHMLAFREHAEGAWKALLA